MIVIEDRKQMLMSVVKAAEFKRCSPLYIKAQLKKGVEWGEAIKISPNRWNYRIFTTKFLDSIGYPYRVDIKEETL